VTAEFGVFCLALALLTSLLQATYLLPVKAVKNILGRVLPVAAWLQAFFIASAFAMLMVLRLDSDFSVMNVVAHSNLSLPTIYKIAGTWGNHEGSMLLWVLVLAVFGALLANGRDTLKLYAISIQSLLCAGFLGFILYTSNPFARIFPPAVDGEALNPLLQDMGLALHPPLLYLGYVGFSIAFSLAVAALIQGRAGREWAQAAHPWIMAAWSALTLGIGMGSWWAYRELGWGGWWFWDPVENASLMPWLAGTALLHSNIVLKKRGLLAPWVILLSIVTFSLSLLGTFLVRSGAITSVHSFASDPERGVYILAYIFLTVGGALLLYSLRGGKIAGQGQMEPLSREGMIVINNLLLLSACAAVLLGTLYPMLAELTSGDKITVGPPFFHVTFVPLMALPLVFAGLTPFMAWKKASFKSAISAMRPAMLAALAALFIVIAFTHARDISTICGFSLAVWLAAGSVKWLLGAKGRSGRYAVFLGHIGAALMVAGITASAAWKDEVQLQAAAGDLLNIAGYNVTYKGSKDITGENYTAKQAELQVVGKDGAIISSLFPEYRTYSIRGSNTSETDIYYSPVGDIYSVIGETSPEGKTAIRLYFQPMISLIWLGFMLMALGGITSIIKIRKYQKP
jgi:cytochrome c-type biogenesis protein CcmF